MPESLTINDVIANSYVGEGRISFLKTQLKCKSYFLIFYFPHDEAAETFRRGVKEEFKILQGISMIHLKTGTKSFNAGVYIVIESTRENLIKLEWILP